MVGVDPSVVQNIDGDGVVVLTDTVCVEAYVPPAGEKVGVAAVGMAIVYDAAAGIESL